MSAQLPHLTGRFEIRISEITEAQFAEVTIPEISHTPVEFREGKDPELVMNQMIGMRKYGEGSLKEGSSTSMEVFNWFTKSIVEGKDIRKTFIIAQIDGEGNDTMTWEVMDALPVAIKTDPLKSTERAVHYSELTYVPRKVTRIS